MLVNSSSQSSAYSGAAAISGPQISSATARIAVRSRRSSLRSAARSSGSVRAAVHSSIAAQNGGSWNVAHISSIARSTRSRPVGWSAMSAAARGLHLGEQRRRQVPGRGHQQLGAGREVVQQPAAGDAGAGLHGEGGGAGVAVLDEAGDGRVEDQQAAVGGALRAGPAAGAAAVIGASVGRRRRRRTVIVDRYG